jgi:hypothetical protein
MYTLTKVDQGVANGDDKIAEIVAQSKENAVNPNPVKPEPSWWAKMESFQVQQIQESALMVADM